MLLLKENSMKKISVIIPMYNSFHMMERNFSVLSKQVDAEIEIIIVDDCSADDSFIKAKEYAEKSELNIIVIKNDKNGGPGYSRNNGIKYATGDYFTFVDSDDYLSDDFSTIIAPYLAEEYDCVIFDYANVDENGTVLSYGKSIGGKNIQPGNLEPKTAFVYTYGSTCGKIYKKELVVNNDIRFGELFRNDDMPFTKVAIALSERVYYCNKCLYMYVQHSNSLMHNESLINEQNSQIAFSLLSEKLQGRGFEEELLALELREVLNNTVLIKVAKKESRKDIIQFIRLKYKKEHFKNKYFSDQPTYLKIISWCAYYRLIFLIKLIWKYKRWKRSKAV